MLHLGLIAKKQAVIVSDDIETVYINNDVRCIPPEVLSCVGRIFRCGFSEGALVVGSGFLLLHLYSVYRIADRV